MNTMASARSSAGIARWASLGGILYVVLFVIGVIVMFDGEPDSDASPATVIAYYAKASHRDKISIGWIIAGLGIFAFLWFLSSLRRAVRRWEGDDGFLTALIHAADDASYVLHATGGAGASAMIIAATLAAMRATAIPKWAGWLGIIAGILALASIIFFPQAAIALWILIVSGLLFARGGQSRPAVAG